MKTKRFLLMALLSGVLVLSACSLGSSKKKDNDEDEAADNFQPDDYKGKEGATTLSEDEWEKAFSIEETILHRSVKVAFQASSSEGSTNMTTEIDHGKMKVTGSGTNVYVSVDSVNKNKQEASCTFYMQGEGGAWQNMSYTANYRELCIDLGLLEFSYADFTYDESSKTYKGGAFTYEAGNSIALNVTSCEITIKDGFPSKVELQGTSGNVAGTFTANYSNYGKVKVSLPGQQQGGNNSSSQQGGGNQSALGSEITYSQLMSAFNSRQQANFNHAEAIMDYGGLTTSGSADLVNGEWVSNDDAGFEFGEFVVTEEMLSSLSVTPEGYVLKFYKNSSNNYSIYISGENTVETITMNQYFYITSEVIQSGSTTISVQISWSRR